MDKLIAAITGTILGLAAVLLVCWGRAEALPPHQREVVISSPCAGILASASFNANAPACWQGRRLTALSSAPGWSFTRGSAATAEDGAGHFISFGSGVPRITPLGLLIEPAATNMYLSSGDVSPGQWTKTAITATANSAVGTLGTTTATKLASNIGTATHLYTQQGPFTIPASSTVTHWRVVRGDTVTWVALTVFDTVHHAAWFDLTNGVVGTQMPGVVGSIRPMANGFWLCSITYAPTGTSIFGTMFFAPSDNLGINETVTIPIGNDLYQDVAQLELGGVQSSYVATPTAASATRAADALTLTYAPSGSAALVRYGTASTASPSAASPLNLGASSGAAWVGSFIRNVRVSK